MIKNRSKITKKTETAKVVSGFIPGHPKIEFIGISETNSVTVLQEGNVSKFSDLSPQQYQTLWEFYHRDRGARSLLGNWPVPLERQVELYIYFIICNLHQEPQYPGTSFDTQFITKGEVQLTTREIRTIDFKKDNPPTLGLFKNIRNLLQRKQKPLQVRTIYFKEPSPIQTIQAETIGEFENLFNTIFPNYKDGDLEIIRNVHRSINEEGKQVFKVQVRKI